MSAGRASNPVWIEWSVPLGVKVSLGLEPAELSRIADSPATTSSRTATSPMSRFWRLAWEDLAMLAVGGGAGPVPDGAHDAAGEHHGHGRVTREDREDRSDGHANHNECDVEGMPGVCHVAQSSGKQRPTALPLRLILDLWLLPPCCGSSKLPICVIRMFAQYQ